jgi:hypothetical protein
MANQYRCHLLDKDRVAAIMIIAAEDDAAAVLQADKILERTSCPSGEVWDRDRRVSIISRKSSGA